MDKKINALFKSRRFWVSIAGVVLVSSEQLGFNINADIVQQAVLLMASWIVGDSLRETK